MFFLRLKHQFNSLIHYIYAISFQHQAADQCRNVLFKFVRLKPWNVITADWLVAVVAVPKGTGHAFDSINVPRTTCRARAIVEACPT